MVGTGFNLDHVIVSEHGVFSVETRTYSKLAKGACKIIYRDEGLAINGYKPDLKIIQQVQAQQQWLEKLIARTAGMSVNVKPIVAFPGWYIDNRTSDKKGRPWVLEPKAIPSYINKEPVQLTPQQVRLIANQVSLFIRAKKRAGGT